MAFAPPRTAGFDIPGHLTRAGFAVLMVVASLALGVVVAVMGWWAMLLPAYGAALALAVLAPSRFVFVLLVAGLAFEPGAIDFTGPIGDAIWNLPPGVQILLVVTAGALALRTRASAEPRERLPLIIWMVPVLLVLGTAWGMRNGAPSNLVYHEMRGILFGILAFFIAWRLNNIREHAMFTWALVATFALGVIVLLRYVLYVRTGDYSVPIEFVYAHEDAVFLAFGFVLGCVLFLRAETVPPRLFAAIHCAVTLGAIVGSSRRAASLALFVGVIALFWLLFRFRPVLVIAIAVPALMLGTLYLGAYWNKEYGALAQPARAIRSQIDPSERDKSSDLYRDYEAYNVEQTIRLQRVFGVGFGVPFAQFLPLPDLTDVWPLQSYTPHQNILWLWLKMGFLGITTFLALWVIAFRRCILAARNLVEDRIPYAPMILAAGLLMYVAYAKVDLAFTSSRSAAGLAVLLALALRLPSVAHDRRRGS
jgi:hypothetical protein